MYLMDKRLKIAYLTSEDPKSKYSWSGTTYYMAKALQKHCGDITFFGPIIAFEKRYIGRLIHETAKLILKKNVAYDRSVFVAKKHAKLAARHLAGQTFDVIFAPIAAPEVAFLETDIPIVLAEDATFALLHNYYPLYSNLLGWSAKEGEIVQRMAYKKAQKLLFSSHWAARSALEDYAVEQEKVKIVSLGANLDVIPTRERVLSKKQSDRCRLLFMGIGWERKGGDIAFETLLALEALGIEAELIICGTTPPKGYTHERMTIIPFLNKHNQAEYQQLEKLYTAADFLLLPTRRECTPVSFCEANAFGLPVITSDTGGVSDVIKNGENGFVLPLSARGSAYAETIAGIYRDEQRYTTLVRSSREMFENQLNWDTWGKAVKNILLEAVGTAVPQIDITAGVGQ